MVILEVSEHLEEYFIALNFITKKLNTPRVSNIRITENRIQYEFIVLMSNDHFKYERKMESNIWKRHHVEYESFKRDFKIDSILNDDIELTVENYYNSLYTMNKQNTYYRKLYEYISSRKKGDEVIHNGKICSVIDFDSKKRLMHILNLENARVYKVPPNKLKPYISYQSI